MKKRIFVLLTRLMNYKIPTMYRSRLALLIIILGVITIWHLSTAQIAQSVASDLLTVIIIQLLWERSDLAKRGD
jgi:hypothetical protein